MIAVWCVYGGAAIAVVGAVSVLRPLRFLRIATRWRGALVAACGVALIAVGFALPAPERHSDRTDTRLDEFVPTYQFDEVHDIHIDATPDRVFAAVKAVTADEILFFRTLVWMRRFGRPGPESILNPSEDLPILDVATRTTFLMLAEAPAREILVGTIVMAPRGVRPELTPAAFKALSEQGYAKAAMNFLIEPEGSGTRLTTATRVVAIGDRATRRFARYWRVIYPGSALMRRTWLRAVKQRAEGH